MLGVLVGLQPEVGPRLLAGRGRLAALRDGVEGAGRGRGLGHGRRCSPPRRARPTGARLPISAPGVPGDFGRPAGRSWAQIDHRGGTMAGTDREAPP